MLITNQPEKQSTIALKKTVDDKLNVNTKNALKCLVSSWFHYKFKKM